VLGLTGVRTAASYLDLLIAGQTKEAVNFIAQLTYQGRDLYQFQRDFLEYLRKIMLIKVGNSPVSDYTMEIKAKIEAQAETLNMSRILKLIGLFQAAGQEMKYSSIPSLSLEVASVEASAESTPVLTSASPASTDGAVVNGQPTNHGPASESSDALGASPEQLQVVINSWSNILSKVKEYNHSLLSSLKLAIPAAVQGNKLILVFPYKFHKEAIEARKNKLVVDQVVEEVVGKKLLVVAVMSKDWAEPLPAGFNANNSEVGSENIEISATNNDNPSNELVESALKIMGGEIEPEH
jgi:DNA polymerase III gamma/tau subunit